MMKVNGHWERADTLEDISRIIREYYNSELADKMDYLICELGTMSVDDVCELNELREIIEDIKRMVW